MKSQKGPQKQDYKTPQWFVDDACRHFFGHRATIDLAATAENKKAPVYLDDFSKAPTTVVGSDLWWLNPPFKKMREWAPMIRSLRADGLILIPADVTTAYFRQHLYPYCSVHFLGKRLKFVGQENGFDRALMLLVFRGGERSDRINYYDFDVPSMSAE